MYYETTSLSVLPPHPRPQIFDLYVVYVLAKESRQSVSPRKRFLCLCFHFNFISVRGMLHKRTLVLKRLVLQNLLLRNDGVSKNISPILGCSAVWVL
jgi:hypothetical protein